ncbi:hypothetical protein C4D60_Mb03t08840 [Musa balbisiana]|uniref:RING-type domain-containing protein n=1 Tax=Musa balbisiana TaxID=52838 RepID=A0A4S8J8V9_MUSBA|nr:hypothetical protein C4D60_Mb03t08840 [Musa balbisiana]
MATMVAASGSLGSSPMSNQEKCSRNKRKFQTDSPVLDPSDPSLMESAIHEYEPFPTGPLSNHDLEKHVSACSTCRALTHSLKEVLDLEDVKYTDWSGMMETQLEELLLSNLDIAFKSAIKKITLYGYKESVAINALLRIGRCYGCKDPVSNIVEHALEYLSSGKAVDISSRDNSSEDMRKLQKSLLEDMVNVLRKMRPFYSRGEAMWSLLIHDINLSHACITDGDTFSGSGCNEISRAPAVQSNVEPNTNGATTSVMVESNLPESDKLKPSITHPQITSKAEMPPLGGVPGLTSSKFYASSIVHGATSSSGPMKENPPSSSKSAEEEFRSQTVAKPSLTREKLAGSRKGLAGSSRNRYRSTHSERNNRGHGHRSASRLSKNSNLGNLLLDKKCKSISDSVSMDPKSSPLKLDKTVDLLTSQSYTTQNFSFTAGSSSSGMDKVSNSASLLAANTDASLLLSTNVSDDISTRPNDTAVSKKSSSISSFLCHQAGSNCAADAKDEILVKLVPRVQELQTQLQDWRDWAQQKVMQAARRLSKDKVELQVLRQEKEEATRLLKEKETLEVSMMKKVAETEYAWSKACAQYEMSNATMGKLENENNKLRQALEIAKSHATKLAANCQEASMREIMTLKKIHSWEKEKVMFNEELAAEKNKLSRLRHQLEEAKDCHDQSEATWKQEEKAKEESLMQAAAQKNERENIEASTKMEEDAFILKTEIGLQRYKDDIRTLENQIAKLRLKSCTKIPVLSWDTSVHSNTDMGDSQGSGNGDIRRDRECVMCLTEEMSVVFLPCSHQVVCAKCNELHEKQGMKDCPSCRTPIRRRIYVRSAYS